ncbi:MAG: hypothetical protein L6Q99_08490, partial [Planctomycetes bacterium]|nr:hypothetical protein [Planctomycetota bacterium]
MRSNETRARGRSGFDSPALTEESAAVAVLAEALTATKTEPNTSAANADNQPSFMMMDSLKMSESSESRVTDGRHSGHERSPFECSRSCSSVADLAVPKSRVERDTAPRRCAENLSAAETKTGCGGLRLAYGVFLETADALSPEVLPPSRLPL